jgi:hypothetical protein
MVREAITNFGYTLLLGRLLVLCFIVLLFLYVCTLFSDVTRQLLDPKYLEHDA